MCNKVLEERSDVPKAYFRRAEALIQLKDYELAMNDFQMVIELDPENKAARNKVRPFVILLSSFCPTYLWLIKCRLTVDNTCRNSKFSAMLGQLT